MTFWQKNGWWIPLVVIVLLAFVVKWAEPDEEAVAVLAEGERCLIIDPGHGGADGGAVAANGTMECDLNLDIALRLEALAAFWGEKTELTRSSADISYPADARTIAAKKRADQHTRIEQINGCPGGVLLSIHQNQYPAPQPSGPQVFYSSVSGGEEFAAILQGNLTAHLAPNNRRMAAPVSESVYLMKKATKTAVLVECGFLSNPSELEQLESESYRLKLSAIFLASWLQFSGGITT